MGPQGLGASVGTRRPAAEDGFKLAEVGPARGTPIKSPFQRGPYPAMETGIFQCLTARNSALARTEHNRRGFGTTACGLHSPGAIRWRSLDHAGSAAANSIGVGARTRGAFRGPTQLCWERIRRRWRPSRAPVSQRATQTSNSVNPLRERRQRLLSAWRRMIPRSSRHRAGRRCDGIRRPAIG